VYVGSLLDGITDTETTGPPSALRVDEKVLLTGAPAVIAAANSGASLAGTVILSTVERRRCDAIDTETIRGSMFSAAAISTAICCALSGVRSVCNRISNVTVVSLTSCWEGGDGAAHIVATASRMAWLTAISQPVLFEHSSYTRKLPGPSPQTTVPSALISNALEHSPCATE
jgi:hypothetical protein